MFFSSKRKWGGPDPPVISAHACRLRPATLEVVPLMQTSAESFLKGVAFSDTLENRNSCVESEKKRKDVSVLTCTAGQSRREAGVNVGLFQKVTQVLWLVAFQFISQVLRSELCRPVGFYHTKLGTQVLQVRYIFYYFPFWKIRHFYIFPRSLEHSPEHRKHVKPLCVHFGAPHVINNFNLFVV